MPVTATQVGYIIAQPNSESVYVGAVLITDPYGMPLEFRHTEPITATKIQRILYGDVLEKYILCDVIAITLFEKLERKPDIVIVVDNRILSALDVKSTRAVELIETRVAPLKDFGDRHVTAPGEFLLQLSDTGSPVRVKSSNSKGADDARLDEIAEILQTIGRTMDVFEPIARVQAALKMLAEDS